MFQVIEHRMQMGGTETETVVDEFETEDEARLRAKTLRERTAALDKTGIRFSVASTDAGDLNLNREPALQWWGPRVRDPEHFERSDFEADVERERQRVQELYPSVDFRGMSLFDINRFLAMERTGREIQHRLETEENDQSPEAIARREQKRLRNRAKRAAKKTAKKAQQQSGEATGKKPGPRLSD